MVMLVMTLPIVTMMVMAFTNSDCHDDDYDQQVFFWFFFCVPQLYLWGSPLLGEIFAYVTVFWSNH